MRKRMILIVLTVLLPFSFLHAFTSQSISTVTAVATLTGTGSVSISVELRNVLDDSTTTQIYWSNVTLPTSWKLADAYILLHSTITAPGGGIQIYTNNKADDADPKYTGSGNPAGLVDATNTTKTLPLGWLIKDITSTPEPADPNVNYSWFYFKDKDTPLTNGENYIIVKNENGIHYAQGEDQYGPAPSPDVIYIEANFAAAVTPRTYRTTTLRIEAFVE